LTKKRRDILLLTLLGLLLYGFIYYTFVWSSFNVSRSDLQQQIDQKSNELTLLEFDLARIAEMKRDLNLKAVQSERNTEALLNETNVVESIEFVDRISKLMKKKVNEPSFIAPKKLTGSTTGTSYYEFGVNMSAEMTYNEMLGIINYLEGGTKKVKVATFEITPKEVANQATPQASELQTFNVSLSLKLYSLTLGGVNKVYEYSKNSLSQYNDNEDGVIFIPPEFKTQSNNTAKPGEVKQYADIEIKAESFFTAGANFWVYGAGSSSPINFRTKTANDVKIILSEDVFNVEVVSDKTTRILQGKMPSKKNVTLDVRALYNPKIEEDAKITLNVKIVNNSSKSIALKVEDKNRSAKITDRNGNLILKKSESEKVYIS
jgi:hypothetical protein